MRKIKIHSEPIELYKLLKIEGLAQSGGEAKSQVAAGAVTVNNAIETRKRKKINAGDTIEYDGQTYQIVLGREDADGV